MLKVLSAVLAVLSAAISITIYTATLPALEKQAADNAAAIENIQIYNHRIDLGEHSFSYAGGTLAQHYFINIHSNTKTAYLNTSDLPATPNIYLCDFEKFSQGPATLHAAYFRVDNAYIYYFYSGGSAAFAITSITDTVTKL